VIFQNIDVLHVLSCIVIPAVVEQLRKETTEKILSRVIGIVAEAIPAAIRRFYGKYF
jgi:hypothetical protein